LTLVIPIPETAPAIAGAEDLLFRPSTCVGYSYGHCKGEMLRSFGVCKGTGNMPQEKKSEVLQGTLDLMILKTLHALGPQHGFGIARRIEQASRDVLQLNEGTVYTSLLRLVQQGWIAAEWGTSDNWSTDAGVGLVFPGALEDRISQRLYAGPHFGFLL
jgi:hypothetical protein